MSNDPKQDYFSDGITENIIFALSKTPKLFVEEEQNHSEQIIFPLLGQTLSVD